MKRQWIGIAAVILAGLLDFAANYLAAHYLLDVWGFLIPGGTFVFAFAFVVYDYLRRLHGAWYAVAAILLGFALSWLYAVQFGGGLGRIATAGLIALACSSTTDFLMQTLTLRLAIWKYVAISNAVSLAVDTVVFVQIAFAVLPVDIRNHIMLGQYGAKLLMTLLAIPFVYLSVVMKSSFRRELDYAIILPHQYEKVNR